jgi:hypothetical protein
MRLARALGIAVHRGTLLRLVIDLPDPISVRRRVLGVMTSRCAACVYAAILVDAATGRAIGHPAWPRGRAAGQLA